MSLAIHNESEHIPLQQSASRSLIGSRPAAIAISLLSWTFPRIGFLKLSEVFALLAAPSAAVDRSSAVRSVIKCYLPFICASIFSFCLAVFTIGHGDNFISSDKGVYSSPTLIPFITIIHIAVYLLTIIATTHYFSVAGKQRVSLTLRWTYYVTVFPGLLQIFRIYSEIYFSIPLFERSEVGPFSGVFNAGYLRVMGFEFEPLAYASSLITVCCLSMHNRRRIPWLGLLVLWHTYSVGAIMGALLALIISLQKKLTRFVVPLYAIAFALLCWYVNTHINMLLKLSLVSGSIMERLGALYACVAMWLDHPLGVGLGLYGYFFNHYDASGFFPAEQLDFYPNNDPAMFLAYGGIPFLLAYLYTFQFVFRRARSYWLLIAAMSLLFQSISSYLFFNPAIIVVFSLLLSEADPISKIRRSSKRRLLWLVPFKKLPVKTRRSPPRKIYGAELNRSQY